MAVVLLLLVLTASVAADEDTFIGVNIGTNISKMPIPTQVSALLKAQQIHHVRLYNAEPNMLLALANTSITVSVSVPNDQIPAIAQSNSTAAKWISQYVVPHYPATNITTICIGSEFPTPLLINALKHIHSALVSSNLDDQIKVSTPFSSGIILNPFPPSRAYFNRSLSPVILPILKFLQSTDSYFMINVYPYLDYIHSNGVMPLDYALFEPVNETIDPNTHLRYSNSFDSTIDAAYSAMADLNITYLPIVVSESGWPSKGGANEPDATPDNARTYNNNLVKHVTNKTGTPKHPNIAVRTYIYELYNEDTTPGPLSGKNWGLFGVNGVPVYAVQLTSQGTSGSANGTTNQTYCTAKPGTEDKMLQAALDWACGPGKVDCSPLLQGQPCYEPDSLLAHATYAFDSYYRLMGRAPGSCDFNGAAALTSISPSHDSCTFSESDGKGSRMNSTVPAMDSENSYSSGRFSYGDVFSATNLMIAVVGWISVLL